MNGLIVRNGVDIVRLDEFRQSRVRAGDAFDRRLFTPLELSAARESGVAESVERAADLRLAGVFAAKEAAFKALGLPKGRWHVVEVVHEPSGRPSLRFGPGYDASRIESCDVSISHTGDYVVAVVTALMRS